MEKSGSFNQQAEEKEDRSMKQQLAASNNGPKSSLKNTSQNDPTEQLKKRESRRVSMSESLRFLDARPSTAASLKSTGSDLRSHGSADSSQPLPLGPHTTYFTEDDVHTAWKMLFPQGLEHQVVSKSQVLESLRAFFPFITAREVKDLVGSGNLSVDKLKNLLFNPDVPEFDANVEAFKIVDPHGTGYMDGQNLARLVLQLPGIGYIDEDDLKAIVSVADPDQDGRISMKDFSTIGSWLPEEIDENSPCSLLPRKKLSTALSGNST